MKLLAALTLLSTAASLPDALFNTESEISRLPGHGTTKTTKRSVSRSPGHGTTQGTASVSTIPTQKCTPKMGTGSWSLGLRRSTNLTGPVVDKSFNREHYVLDTTYSRADGDLALRLKFGENNIVKDDEDQFFFVDEKNDDELRIGRDEKTATPGFFFDGDKLRAGDNKLFWMCAYDESGKWKLRVSARDAEGCHECNLYKIL
ncbi:hypothetical protein METBISCDRAFT_24857 [Metschnikowia bicuspidata]|uniref:Uncharacterized protein n=1 Tax=Metschnikowia bicuspidata TaxID=27322 RepID=A0A4P9ZA97_9ASCO|nr:hypothetical protein METBISCDRAFT_24857 [Metschnikowia bicuspidata]